MNLFHPSAFRNACAHVVAALLVLQPFAAYAAPITTKLANVPLQGANPVKSNVMFTMDDSTSMLWAFLPDFQRTSGSLFPWCRDALAKNGSCGDDPALETSTSLTAPPFRSSSFNKIYYDPAIDYLAGVNEFGVTLPHESASPGTWTSVYVDGFAGYPIANTGGTINLTNSFPDEVWCWKDTPTAAELATANPSSTDAGSVCRRNATAYPSKVVGGVTSTSVSAAWNYPNAASGSCVDDATTKCVFAFRKFTTGAPYYYVISNLQYCPSTDANGWGTGACDTRWLPDHPNIAYGASGFDPSALTRIDIIPTRTSYPSGRSYTDEMTNFARWYAFNRTRILAMKTAGGFAFAAIDASSRIGFNTINTYEQNFLNIVDFDDSNKSKWFKNFYAVVPSGSTPTIDAMAQVGEYFSNRNTAFSGSIIASPRPALPNAADPLDPATGKCQPNYHLLATDGFWDQLPRPYTGVAGPINNQDLTVPSDLPGPVAGFTPGDPFPLGYREGSGVENDSGFNRSSSNSMADVAMYYWIHDLRLDLANEVNDEPDAHWQHIRFYGLSIGAEGFLPFPTGIDDVKAGSVQWPRPLNFVSPLTGVSRGPSTTDDLWHAAYNGRGDFYDVQNAEQLAAAIVKALNDTKTKQSGTGAAVGIAGPQLSVTSNFAYLTRYDTGWTGELRKYELDPATGELPVDAAGNPRDAAKWSAQTQIDQQAAGTGWDATRRIVTMNGATPVAFRAGNLSSAQTASLTGDWAAVPRSPTALQIVNYLRGDSSNEGTGRTQFRQRTHTLGDIVYSGAVPVGPPSLDYTDAGYSRFKDDHARRTPMVYVGANDGMLHAIDDSEANGGKESWAFIPGAMFKGEDPNDTSHQPASKFSIGSLSYRVGGLPSFQHRFFVNATPRVWDVDFANANLATGAQAPTSGNDWRTILVGGLGAGGRSIYALDVTDPPGDNLTEAQIVSSGRVLWEFTHDELGYVFDAPTLVKTKRYGWVVLATSGYNNKGGNGKLFVINPTNGALLTTLSTGVGSDTNPSGLSTIRAYTPSRKDPYVLQAYGGDLQGNVWRFDLSDPDETKWKVERIAELKDGQGNAQAITTGIRIEIDQNNFSDRYIFVGTGKLLDQSDVTDDSVRNSLYVIRDGSWLVPEPKPATPYSRSDLNQVVGNQVSGFDEPIGRGWFQDGETGEKIGSDVFADLQTVVYSFSKPASDPCQSTLISTLFARNLNTGSSVLQSAGGSVVASVTDIGAIAGVMLIQSQAGTGVSSSSGDVRAQVTTMKGQVFSFGVQLTGGAVGRHRVSWRLLARE